MDIKVIKVQLFGKLKILTLLKRSMFFSWDILIDILAITGIKTRVVVKPTFDDLLQVVIQRYHDDNQAVQRLNNGVNRVD